jgi:Tfp pilus assembly protein PilN
MTRINLVPAEILEKAKNRRIMFQVSLAGAFVFFLLILASLFHYLSLSHLESRLAMDQARLKKLAVIVAQVEKLEASAKAVRDRLNVITTLVKGRTLYPYFMSDFVRSVPFDIQVRTLSVLGGGSQLSPLKLTISAVSSTQDDIAEWMKRLQNSGRFSNVDLGNVARSGTTQKTYNFALTSVYQTSP